MIGLTPVCVHLTDGGGGVPRGKPCCLLRKGDQLIEFDSNPMNSEDAGLDDAEDYTNMKYDCQE